MKMEREYDEYLSNKMPALNNPGTRLSLLYPSRANSSIELVESMCYWNNKFSLTSLSFGSSNQVFLPNGDFVGLCMLRLRLPLTVTNQSLCRGWGLNMIKQIRYVFGSNSSTPTLITKEAIWHCLMAQCKSIEKKSQMLTLCGDEYLGIPPTIIGEDVPVIEAFVPLPLPFSTVCEHYMFDSSISAQPISIIIDFESNSRAIYGGVATPPTAFAQAELLVRTQLLADRSKSLRNAMAMDPELKYQFPYCMPLGYNIAQFTGVRESDGGSVNLQLNQFQNADLIGIVFSVRQLTDVFPTGNSTPNPFHVDAITNIVLSYNGSSIIQWPGKAYRAASAYMENQEGSSYQGSYVLAGSVSPFSSSPKDEYLIYFDFTQFRGACMPEHMFNCWRIPPGNSLNLSFNTSQGPSVTYIANYTCLYNAVVVAQAGATEIVTA